MSIRSNLWTFVVYPDDSLPENWMNIIQSWHLPVLASPIHDADHNADDTEKKKHIHIMIYFGVGANKGFEQVCDYTKQLHGCLPQIVHSRNAYVRYFIHRDNPEKSQRSKDMNRDWTPMDLHTWGGFDYMPAFENFTTDRELYMFIEGIIKDNKICNLVDLETYLSIHSLDYEGMFMRKHQCYFLNYLNAMYRKTKYRC